MLQTSSISPDLIDRPAHPHRPGANVLHTSRFAPDLNAPPPPPPRPGANVLHTSRFAPDLIDRAARPQALAQTCSKRAASRQTSSATRSPASPGANMLHPS